MNLELDIEQIRTFLLMGDVGSAVKWMEKRLTRAKFMQMATKKQVYADLQEAYGLLLEMLKGKLSPDDMVTKLLDPMYANMFGNIEDVEVYLNNFAFYARYSIDRYNVDYPNYDQKRCGDQ